MVLKLEFTDYIDSIALSAKHHEDTQLEKVYYVEI